MWNQAQWIGVPKEEIIEKQIYQGDMNGRFVYYRHTFNLDEPCTLEIDISANARYRLWVNGTAVQSGPCRSDRYRQYYEHIDVSSYLKTGRNVLAAQVLYCDRSYLYDGTMDPRAPLVSQTAVASQHRLGLEGMVKNLSGEDILNVTTGIADWKEYLDDTFYLVADPGLNGGLGAVLEHIDFRRTLHTWKDADFDDSRWNLAVSIEPVQWDIRTQIVGIYLDYHMTERPIPLLLEEKKEITEELGQDSFAGQDVLTVPKGETKTLLFALSVLSNTHPVYQFQQGRNAKVSMTYFERFRGTDIRDDYINGKIEDVCMTDTLVLDGTALTYEPFWWRTFRFLKIVIEASDEDVIFKRPAYYQTGYPLEVTSRISSSEPWVEKLFDMCVNTLKGCMMETYMDCPFWEQLQYVMDTRLQMMYTYVLSLDTKLARKAIEDFHCSRVAENLIQGRAPTGLMQVISTFSMPYIFMIWEYYERTGDMSVLKQYRSDVDGILEYFDSKVGPSGLVEHIDYWAFVDWLPEWGMYAGAPSAYFTEASSLINLMYAYGLKTGAKICRASGREGVAAEYEARQQAICRRVHETCYDAERGLYREGATTIQFTQHTQSWAVLNEMITGDEARALMEKAMTEEDVLHCTFSTSNEIFRACEKTGIYDKTKPLMQLWIDLIDQHLTTCPEVPVNARSECHAWSAQPVYELFRSIAGIQSDFQSIRIEPHMNDLPDLKGEMDTEAGPIKFNYKKSAGTLTCELIIPEGPEAVFIRQDGSAETLSAGINIVTEAL